MPPAMRQRSLFWAGRVGALLLVAGWVYLPPMKGIQGARGEWARLKEDHRQAHLLMKRFEQGRSLQLKAVDALSEALAELNQVARAHKVQLLEIAPGTSTAADPTALMILPVELTVEAEYRPLGEFLGALRDGETLGAVYVRQITISREEPRLPRLKARLLIEMAFRQVVSQ